MRWVPPDSTLRLIYTHITRSCATQLRLVLSQWPSVPIQRAEETWSPSRIWKRTGATAWYGPIRNTPSTAVWLTRPSDRLEENIGSQGRLIGSILQSQPCLRHAFSPDDPSYSSPSEPRPGPGVSLQELSPRYPGSYRVHTIGTTDQQGSLTPPTGTTTVNNGMQCQLQY